VKFFIPYSNLPTPVTINIKRYNTGGTALSLSAPPPITSSAWSDRTKRTIAIIVLVVIGIALWQLADVLPMVIVALVMAYLFHPLTDSLERRVFRRLPGARGWSILVTFVIAISLVVLFFLVVVPGLIAQFQEFAEDLPRALATIQADIRRLLTEPLVIGGQTITIGGQPLILAQQFNLQLEGENLTDAIPLENIDLFGTTQTFIGTLSAPVTRVVGGAFTAIFNLVLLLTIIFYLLKDGGYFIRSIINVTPADYQDDVRRLLFELSQVWDGYLRGQIASSTFVGVLVFFAALLLGLPTPQVLGLLSAVLDFVPNIGPLIAVIPAALLALFSQSSTLPGLGGVAFALLVIVIWTIIQNIQSTIVAPRLLGDSLKLHPVVIIIGVLAGASLAGALGVILAAPIIASLRVLGQYIYGKLRGVDPFPPPPPRQLQPNLFARVTARFRPQRIRKKRARVY
jgi:predicted PurR-regulated permease PerM